MILFNQSFSSWCSDTSRRVSLWQFDVWGVTYFEFHKKRPKPKPNPHTLAPADCKFNQLGDKWCMVGTQVGSANSISRHAQDKTQTESLQSIVSWGRKIKKYIQSSISLLFIISSYCHTFDCGFFAPKVQNENQVWVLLTPWVTGDFPHLWIQIVINQRKTIYL
jgi:hypothetical protein